MSNIVEFEHVWPLISDWRLRGGPGDFWPSTLISFGLGRTYPGTFKFYYITHSRTNEFTFTDLYQYGLRNPLRPFFLLPLPGLFARISRKVQVFPTIFLELSPKKIVSAYLLPGDCTAPVLAQVPTHCFWQASDSVCTTVLTVTLSKKKNRASCGFFVVMSTTNLNMSWKQTTNKQMYLICQCGRWWCFFLYLI